MTALAPASEIAARRRVCTDCREVELEPDAIGDLCPACALDHERHRAAMRDQALSFEAYHRDRRDHRGCCGACGSWSGPAPLGGKHAHCRKVGEMREARA